MTGLSRLWHAWRAYRLRKRADAHLKLSRELNDRALDHDFAANPHRRTPPSGSHQPQGP